MAIKFGFGKLLFFLFPILTFTSCNKNSGSEQKDSTSKDALRVEFYNQFNSLYRNVGGDIWAFPVDGTYRMLMPNTSKEDKELLQKYKQFIEIRGWNNELEDIDLTADNIDEVLDYCIKKAG